MAVKRRGRRVLATISATVSVSVPLWSSVTRNVDGWEVPLGGVGLASPSRSCPCSARRCRCRRDPTRTWRSCRPGSVEPAALNVTVWPGWPGSASSRERGVRAAVGARARVVLGDRRRAQRAVVDRDLVEVAGAEQRLRRRATSCRASSWRTAERPCRCRASCSATAWPSTYGVMTCVAPASSSRARTRSGATRRRVGRVKNALLRDAVAPDADAEAARPAAARPGRR